jgi:hypothetical protein
MNGRSKVMTIESGFNKGTPGLLANLNQWLLANADLILIRDVDLARFEEDALGGKKRIRIAYEVGGSVTGEYIARVYTPTATASAQQVYSAEQTASDALVPFFMLDITDLEEGSGNSPAFLVIAQDKSADPSIPEANSLFLVEPQGIIAPLASGNALVLDEFGATLLIAPVTNLGDTAWAAGERGYAVEDPTSGALIGIPTCNGAAVVLPPAPTVTTPYANPALLNQSAPVGFPGI